MAVPQRNTLLVAKRVALGLCALLALAAVIPTGRSAASWHALYCFSLLFPTSPRKRIVSSQPRGPMLKYGLFPRSAVMITILCCAGISRRQFSRTRCFYQASWPTSAGTVTRLLPLRHFLLFSSSFEQSHLFRETRCAWISGKGIYRKGQIQVTWQNMSQTPSHDALQQKETGPSAVMQPGQGSAGG